MRNLRVLLLGLALTLSSSLVMIGLVAAAPKNAVDPDPGFGGVITPGKVVTEFARRNDHAEATATQPDGKIVVVGGTNGANAVARYNSDGTLDSSFGVGGTVSFPGDNAALSVVAIQDDSRIVVGGTSFFTNYYRFNYYRLKRGFIARLLPNGNLDSNFNVVFPAGGGTYSADEVVTGLAVQPDGKIVAAGRSLYTNLSSYQYNLSVLERFNQDGTTDTSFAGGRIELTNGEPFGLSLQSDRKLVVGGTLNNSTSVIRYNAD